MDSVVYFLLVFKHPMRHLRMIPDVTQKLYTQELNKAIIKVIRTRD